MATDNPLIANGDDMLQVLEQDLKNKITNAIRSRNLLAIVDGVFDIDELEQRMENSIATGRIAFGISYQGMATGQDTEHGARHNVDHGQGVGFGHFVFAIIMAARIDATCVQRLGAHRILTILRKEINQSTVQVGRRAEAVRTWMLVQEKPETSQSSSDMLYYSQVFRITLPLQTK